MAITDAAGLPRVSGVARVMLGLLAVLCLAAFVVVADLGINAGRIHYGVHVGDVGLGGLTPSEAVSKLAASRASDPLARRMRTTPLVFSGHGLRFEVVPARVGWIPHPADTTHRAMKVGRKGGLLSAALQRAKAWVVGERVVWVGRPSAKKVGIVLNRWKRVARRHGYVLDTARMRFKLRWTMSSWPRRPAYRLPLTARR